MKYAHPEGRKWCIRHSERNGVESRNLTHTGARFLDFLRLRSGQALRSLEMTDLAMMTGDAILKPYIRAKVQVWENTVPKLLPLFLFCCTIVLLLGTERSPTPENRPHLCSGKGSINSLSPVPGATPPRRGLRAKRDFLDESRETGMSSQQQLCGEITRFQIQKKRQPCLTWRCICAAHPAWSWCCSFP